MPKKLEPDAHMKVSKTTEKAVADLRIKSIENGIRSISSMLDTRILYELDPMERKNHKLEKKMQEKRFNTRRGNNLSHDALLNQGALALQALKEQGQQIAATTEEYGDEEKIWKHKYRTPTYNQKRIFDNPKLHEYYRKLNTEEQREFRIQCRESLYKLSSDLRSQLTNARQDMDNRGIFHPAANAHRAHCMYLLKIYKTVDASTVEDPVLKAMKKDDPRCDNDGTEHALKVLSSARGPVSRPTTSSSQRQKDPLRRVTTPQSLKKRPLLALLTAGDISQQPSGDAAGPFVSDKTQSKPGKGVSDSALRVPAKAADPLSRQGSKKGLTPKPGSPDGPRRPMVKSGTGTAVEAGLGMDNFVEGASSDWMIHRLQKEQIDASVSISGNQLSTPLPSRSEGLQWKHIPVLQERSRMADDDKPIISFDEFQALFQKVLRDAEEEAAHLAEASRSVDHPTDAEDSKSAVTAQSSGSVSVRRSLEAKEGVQPAVSAAKVGKTGLTKYGHKKHSGRNATFLGNLTDPASQKVVASMQPHLDAFVGVRTKKKHTMEIVNKMMSTLPKTVIKSETLKPKVDDESRPKIVSKVGYQAVRAQSAKATLSGSSPVMRRKGPVGFRNVFRDDESSVAIDEKSMSASMLESVNTMSDTDDDDYSTESDDEGSRPNSGPMCVRASVTGKFGRQRKAVSKSHSAQVMQELQSAIWETLQVPTVERIAVMGKYSSEMFARVFDESISLWTDVAILVACRIELKKVYVALQRGLLTIDSDHGDFFFRLIFDKIPKPFKLTYNPDVRYRKRTGPDAHVFSLFEEVKSFLLVEEDPLEMSRQDALVKLLDAAKRIDDRLIHSLDDAESRFFDTIPYGITSCKEWLANKAQKFPIPKT